MSDPYAGIDLQQILAAILAEESGDASSQQNVVDDWSGGMFDPAMGLVQSMQGDPAAFDWSQLFQYETPEMPEAPTVYRRAYERASQSADPVEQQIAMMVDAGMSAPAIKNFLRTDEGTRAMFEVVDGDTTTLDTDRLKIYDGIADTLESEYDTFRNEMETYEKKAQEASSATPTLVETDLVDKFRKAGIPLPTDRPTYTADDFSAGASDRANRSQSYADQHAELSKQIREVSRGTHPEMQAPPRAPGASTQGARSGGSRVQQGIWGQRPPQRQPQSPVSAGQAAFAERALREQRKKMYKQAPKLDFAAMIADQQGRGQADQLTAAGRTPTGDAILARLLGQGGF